jgi:hypothetical protein
MAYLPFWMLYEGIGPSLWLICIDKTITRNNRMTFVSKLSTVFVSFLSIFCKYAIQIKIWCHGVRLYFLLLLDRYFFNFCGFIFNLMPMADWVVLFYESITERQKWLLHTLMKFFVITLKKMTLSIRLDRTSKC